MGEGLVQVGVGGKMDVVDQKAVVPLSQHHHHRLFATTTLHGPRPHRRKTPFSSANTSATTPERRARPAPFSSPYSLLPPAKTWPMRNLFLLLSNSKKFSSPNSDQI